MDINDTYAEPTINEGYLPYWAKDDAVVSIYFYNGLLPLTIKANEKNGWYGRCYVNVARSE